MGVVAVGVLIGGGAIVVGVGVVIAGGGVDGDRGSGVV